MTRDHYLEIITNNLLRASIAYRAVFTDIMLNGINKASEIMLKDIKTNLEEAIRAIDNLLEENPYAYIIIIDVFGQKQYVECDSKKATIELADSFHGDDGKAYIFTNDLSVGGREEKVGGTIVCESQDDVYKKADKMYHSK